MKILLLFVVFVSSDVLNNPFDEEYRKYYGLSNYNQCPDYPKTFKCLTACKSMGYRIFRLDSRCKCTCHEMKTTTILPFFKWRTNGTTRKLPETYSVSLYHIVGTLSPATERDISTTITTITRPPATEDDISTENTTANDTEISTTAYTSGSAGDDLTKGDNSTTGGDDPLTANNATTPDNNFEGESTTNSSTVSE